MSTLLTRKIASIVDIRRTEWPHAVTASVLLCLQSVCQKTGRKIVTAVLEDGRRFEGDILIGADGIWSKVRLPRCGWLPTERMLVQVNPTLQLQVTLWGYSSRVHGIRCTYSRMFTECLTALASLQVRRKLVGESQPNYSQYTCYTGISDFTPPDIDTVGCAHVTCWKRNIINC